MKSVIHNPTAAVASPLILAVNPGVEQAMEAMVGAFLPIIIFLFLGAAVMFGLGFVLRIFNFLTKSPTPRKGRRRRRVG